MFKKLLSLLSLGLLMAGCRGTVTNLTPRQEFRNASGLYPVEAAFITSQQSARWDSVKANVIAGQDFYPMRYTQHMTNRWETLIPAPPGTKIIYYRFKFDYLYNAFGSPPKGDSKLSPIYRLQIVDQ